MAVYLKRLWRMEKLKREELSDLRRQKLERPQNPWESVKHGKIYLLSPDRLHA